MKNAAFLLFSCLLSAVLAIAGYRYFEPPAQPLVIRETVPQPVQTALPPASASARLLPVDFRGAAARTTPAVVNIKSDKRFDLWLSSRHGGSSGSGVLISPDGYLLTNNHVIEDGDEYLITLHDNREVEAALIGVDPTTDLALLKINPNPAGSEFPYVVFGDSDSLQVGEWVMAVGNPFNLTSTVTAGIVSAKGRNINILDDVRRIESFIQTDAAVNPGNSGGALVNERGELVGINTAIITRSGKYEGYSFAVPSNLAAKVVSDLRDYGAVQRGLLGVKIESMNQELAQRLRLKSAKGVLVEEVYPGTGAELAGLQANDVIVQINDVAIPDVPVMQEVVGRFRPGNTLRVEYLRNGKRETTRVTLRNEQNETELSVPTVDADVFNQLGFELRDLTTAERQRLRTGGVYVTGIRPNSVIDNTDMSPGYIITNVNDRRVGDIGEFQEMLDEYRGKILLEGFYEEFEGAYYYQFRR